MPNLRGRWFNVALCCDCWDRLNPDRAMSPEHKAELEATVLAAFKTADKDDVAANRCAACEEQPDAGIFVRVNVQMLRDMRPK